MSSDLFVYDNPFFPDPFSPFPLEVLEEIQENGANFVPENLNSSIDEITCLDQIKSALLSSSPPSVQLENLQIRNAAYSVKTEDFPLSFESGFGNPILPQSFMQRSYSSNSFERKQNLPFQPQFDSVWEPHQTLQNQIPDSVNGSIHIRRVCSTGDLQNVKNDIQTRNVLSSSPLSKSFMEETSFKVGKYSVEERKERIDRYRAKRTQRNFNKTIKYACRKTLADNRPRIRGRFARNDEAGEIPKASRYEEEDDLWIDALHEEDDEASVRRWTFFNESGSESAQYQSFSYS